MQLAEVSAWRKRGRAALCAEESLDGCGARQRQCSLCHIWFRGDGRLFQFKELLTPIR